MCEVIPQRKSGHGDNFWIRADRMNWGAVQSRLWLQRLEKLADRGHPKTLEDTAWHGLPPGSDSLSVQTVGLHVGRKRLSDLQRETEPQSRPLLAGRGHLQLSEPQAQSMLCSTQISVFIVQQETLKRFQSAAASLLKERDKTSFLLECNWRDTEVVLHNLNTFPGETERQKSWISSGIHLFTHLFTH